MTSLLTVEAVSKQFEVGGQRSAHVLRAVEDVSFALESGQTLGIVGESGCGKTTLARLILRLIKPSSGRILFDGRDITSASERRMRDIRGSLQAVFQDPFGSLDPRMRVRDIVGEPLVNLGWLRGKIEERVAEVLDVVGLPPEYMLRYPHAFSGGQRQRIGIARALAPSPRMIVCDEAVSALDVSIQAQILNLFKEILERFGVSYVCVSHNLAVVRHLSHRVAVMYLGRIVEIGEESDIFRRPLHPYTRALIAAVPKTEPGAAADRSGLLEGDLPSPLDPPAGCAFHTRCPIVQKVCKSLPPELLEYGEGHRARCHFADVAM
jgi:oligopeptide/dipeptide ABC transporter ATP-binding protein